MLDLAGHDHHRRGEVDVLAGIVLERLVEPAALLHPVELEQEVGVEEVAAELAVGNRLEAKAFLPFHQCGDGFVLDPAQGLVIDVAGGAMLARFNDRTRTQE